jgi:hypothetical protein
VSASRRSDSGGEAADPRGRDPVEEWSHREIQHAAERVCALILYSDLPLIDIKIAAANVRRLCIRLQPERVYLYDWIYARRFRRLWEQWRAGERWT